MSEMELGLNTQIKVTMGTVTMRLHRMPFITISDDRRRGNRASHRGRRREDQVRPIALDVNQEPRLLLGDFGPLRYPSVRTQGDNPDDRSGFKYTTNAPGLGN